MYPVSVLYTVARLASSGLKGNSMSLNPTYQVFDTGEEMVDSETGEVLTPIVSSPKPKGHDDSETGEQAQTRLVYQRSKFKVPRSALTLPVFDTALLDAAPKKVPDQSCNLTLLILPLLMLLPGWAIVLYVMAETLYHTWSHTLKPDRHPVNTPLRLLFNSKCAECVARKQMQKVGQLQDAWSLKVSTRRILNYNYAKLCTGS